MFAWRRIRSTRFSPESPDEGWARAGMIAIAIALLLLAFASLAIGRYPLSLKTVMDSLKDGVTGGTQAPPMAQTVVLAVRLPRIIAAVMIGAGLAMAGSAYQSLFRNPMASPALLGVSAGAGFGAALALLFRQPYLVVQAASFLCGLATVALAFLVNWLIGGRSIVTLVLCGMVFSALFQALISILEYVADPLDVLPAIAFWLMGSLAKTDAREALSVSLAVFLCGSILYLNRWRIHLLGLGDEEAAALGLDIGRTKILVIACATLMSSATVSVGGIIGWVGLLVPHLARILFGMEPARLIPATALLGGLFLLGVDDMARSMTAVEIPIGVLTAVVGTPFFLLLLLHARHGHWA